MDKAYHTLNEGIPADKSQNRIGMDTGYMRNWLNLWVSGKTEEGKNASVSVHLSREDAANLVEEINHRLF